MDVPFSQPCSHPSPGSQFKLGTLDQSFKKSCDWFSLSENPAAIPLLTNNMDKINWHNLSLNPAAIHLLEANPNKINWSLLSQNPAALSLLKANPYKIDWINLSRNPAAIDILEANQDKVDWHYLSFNPAIFVENIWEDYFFTLTLCILLQAILLKYLTLQN
jgi:hypothetical protein